VVIGRNEGARLVRCLESIRAADWPADKLEIVYVDSASTDDSCARAKELGARVVEIRPERPSAAAGRNAGLAVATYDFVQFMDGDTVLHRDWLRKAIAAFRDPRVVCVFGQRSELEPTRNIYHFWTHHDWASAPGPAKHCGGDAMFRREALLRVDGYDAGLIAGEERDLTTRLLRACDCVVLCLGEPMTGHDIGIQRFSQYWRRCVRSGYAYAEVSARYPELEEWRRIVRRNLTFAAVTVGLVAAAAIARSAWPLALWLGLLLAGLTRDALRSSARVGSLRGGVLIAVHHYLSKIPTIAGHLDYYGARALGKGPRGLIEYRGA
jgi:cellulose synthase/poly-beta-1,6-N-acetylglucosamine synthase-like glycosyltransferase